VVIITLILGFSCAPSINTGPPLGEKADAMGSQDPLRSPDANLGIRRGEILKYEFRSQWLPKRVQVFVSPSRLLLMVKSKWLESYK
jgi:hypothetical protein